jgi:hypothetical protein
MLSFPAAPEGESRDAPDLPDGEGVAAAAPSSVPNHGHGNHCAGWVCPGMCYYLAWAPASSVVCRRICCCNHLELGVCLAARAPFALWPSCVALLASLTHSLVLLSSLQLASAHQTNNTIYDPLRRRGWLDSCLRGTIVSSDRFGAASLDTGLWRYLGILILVSCSTYAFRIHAQKRGRRKTSQSIGLVAFAMAFFTVVSLLLVMSVCPWESRAQSSPTSTAIATDTASYRPVFTVPTDADVGMNVLPNIYDAEAANPQTVCPGYHASNVQQTSHGFTAELDLAGEPCNVYGNEINNLTLLVEYQADDRLHVHIHPRFIAPENVTWFILPEELIPRPKAEAAACQSSNMMDLYWSNEPTFSFTVKRSATNDTLFTTEGTVLVFEDQFIEFGSALPENYNLYGLGEVMHGFRLNNNLTSELPTD